MSVRNQKVGTKSESGLKQSPKCCGLTLTCVTTTKIPIIFVGLGNEAKAEAVPAATLSADRQSRICCVQG